ncbi:MAG: lipoprotein insertase outer membrane protein LolB [Dokdonella sp.]
MISSRAARHLAALVLALVLAGCAQQRIKPDAEALATQATRERALSVHGSWNLSGRLAVSNGKEGGSGSLQWSRDGDAFRFEVHAPVTGKTWTLTGDRRHAELSGLGDHPITGGDASALLTQELGWHVPLTELDYWVRGMRAPGDADLTVRGDGLPLQIKQAGWKVEYLDYDASLNPPMPRKLFAERGTQRVRLVIQQWTLH